MPASDTSPPATQGEDSTTPTPSPSARRGRGRGAGRGRGRGTSAGNDEAAGAGPVQPQVPDGGPIVEFDVYVKDTFAAKDKNPVSLEIQAPNAEALGRFIEDHVLNPDRDWVQGFAQVQNGQWTLTDCPPVREGNPNLSYYVSIFNRSARHTFKAMAKSGTSPH